MGSLFSRRDFLPLGLKADQVELDGNRIRVHAHSLDASAAWRIRIFKQGDAK